MADVFNQNEYLFEYLLFSSEENRILSQPEWKRYSQPLWISQSVWLEHNIQDKGAQRERGEMGQAEAGLNWKSDTEKV